MERLMLAPITPDQFLMLLRATAADGVKRTVIHTNSSSAARVIHAGWIRQCEDGLYRLTASGEAILHKICNANQS
jgi:hypothetical protein